MKTWKQNAFLGFLAILVLMVALVACDNDTKTPVSCDCAEGYIHLAGEPKCCEGEDCVCEKNVVGVRVHGIPATNRNNVLVESDFIKGVTLAGNALGALETNFESDYKIVIKYFKELGFNSDPTADGLAIKKEETSDLYTGIISIEYSINGVRNGFLDFVRAHPELTAD